MSQKPTISENQFDMNSQVNQNNKDDVKLKLNQISCRICLSNQNQSKLQFIAPCNCSGSVKHVHKKCYYEWILHIYQHLQTSEQKQKMENQGFQCQICKSIIKVQFKHQRCLVDRQEFKKICQNSISLTITIILFFMIAIAAFSFLVYFADHTKQQFNKQNGSQALFTVLSIIIIVVFFCTGLFFFISNYVFVKKMKVLKTLHQDLKQ